MRTNKLKQILFILKEIQKSLFEFIRNCKCSRIKYTLRSLASKIRMQFLNCFKYTLFISVTLPIVLIFLLLWNSQVFAALSADELKAHKESGQSIAKSLESNVAGSFQNMDIHELKEIVGYEGSNVRGAGMSIEQAESSGEYVKQQNDEKAIKELRGEPVEYSCDKETCEVGHTFSSVASLKRQEELDKQGFERDENGMPINKHAYLDKALNAIKNNEFDYLSGSSSNCQPTEETITTSNEETCDQYFDLKTSSCFPKQIVEIDPEYKYQCYKKRELKKKTCVDVIKHINCKKTISCSAAGLFTPDSNNELMQSSGGLTLKATNRNGSTILELGNNKHWTYDTGSNGCEMKEFIAKFFIKNVKQVATFRLFEVFENNLLHISINGTTIYNGLGGNDLILGPGNGMGRVIYGGNGKQGTCGINSGHQHWKGHNYDILAAGLLREGENHIQIKLAYHWYGHAGFKIEATNYCCREFDIEREEKCNYS